MLRSEKYVIVNILENTSVNKLNLGAAIKSGVALNDADAYKKGDIVFFNSNNIVSNAEVKLVHIDNILYYSREEVTLNEGKNNG
jgi:hypothetical protein